MLQAAQQSQTRSGRGSLRGGGGQQRAVLGCGHLFLQAFLALFVCSDTKIKKIIFTRFAMHEKTAACSGRLKCMRGTRHGSLIVPFIQ